MPLYRKADSRGMESETAKWIVLSVFVLAALMVVCDPPRQTYFVAERPHPCEFTSAPLPGFEPCEQRSDVRLPKGITSLVDRKREALYLFAIAVLFGVTLLQRYV